MSKPKYIVIPESFQTECCPNCGCLFGDHLKYIVADSLDKPFYSKGLVYYYFNLRLGYAICHRCARKVKFKRFVLYTISGIFIALAILVLAASSAVAFQGESILGGIALLLIGYGVFSIAIKFGAKIRRRTLRDESARKLSAAIDVLRNRGWYPSFNIQHALSAHYDEGEIKRDLDAAFGVDRYYLVHKSTGETVDYLNNPGIFEEVFLRELHDND